MSKARQVLEELCAQIKTDEAREQQRAAELQHLRREAEAEHPPPKGYAQLAIARHAANAGEEQITLIAPPQPENEIAEFNHTTDAASFWLSYYQMPPRLRALVDALCGLSGDSDDWFEAPDVKIAKRMGRSTKTIQRDRDDFDAWQKAENVTFIEIEDHFTDRKGVRHPHKYRVHLSRLAVKAKLIAQASSKWNINPEKATEQAVKELRAEAPEMPPRKSHKRRDPGLDQIIESDLRRAGNLLLKSAKNRKSAELVNLTHGYTLPVKLKPELINALEHSLAILKGETEPDQELLAPLEAKKEKCQPRPSGQNVRKETIHSEALDQEAMGKDMPSDTPVSEYRRVPSIARAMHEIGERPPQE